MGDLHDYKPAMVMFGLQVIYAGVSLTTRAALLQGMSPRVFVAYRQAIAALVIAPIAYFTRRKRNSKCLGWRSFWLIFFTTLIGVTINQNIFFEGLYLATSSMGSALGNLVPAVTFVIASTIGLEKVDMRSVRSMAKIIGTVLCVSGAVFMAFLRGPKLLNTQFLPSKSLLSSEGGEDWLLGCVFLFASCCCWSVWLILQVPLSRCYPDHLSLTAWMCFIAMLQSATVALFFDRDLQAWNLQSNLQLSCCFFTGISSAISFFGQAWCISHRGPLFSAMFNPLSTVIVTIFASIFLHEEIYSGSLVGAVAVVIGLYTVLWGKAKDLEEFHVEADPKPQNDQTTVKIMVDQIDLEEPLLSDKINRS
ncbi:hypothetical protein ACSBR1_025925 [Camellia fascicularis]